MARYRKIDTRIWNDEKFRSLSDDGKLVFFFLLTHPHMTSIGAMRATLPGLAAEIGWDVERLSEAFAEALAKGMAKHDPAASMIWLPKFIRYNEPESPNVLKAWAGALDLLPECDLTREAIQSVKDFAEGLSKGFREALPQAFRQPSRQPSLYPEQEQEQEQEPEKDSRSTVHSHAFERFWAVWPSNDRKVAKVKCAEVWKRFKLDPLVDGIIKHVEALRSSKQWADGYYPMPSTYLNQRRWEDGEAIGGSADPSAGAI